MKPYFRTIHNLLSLTVSLILTVGLSAQEVPEENPGGSPPENVPGGPPEGAPQGPPPEVQEFLDSLHALQEDFLTVVQGEYESGQDRAAAIQEWLDANRRELEDLEDLKDEVAAGADDIELPDVDLAGGIEEDLDAFEETEEDLEQSLGAIMSGEFATTEERLAAIKAWKADHAEEIAAQEAVRENILAKIEAARANANRGQRPEASQNMRDLEELFDSVLANVGADNEALRDRLQAAEQDREARLIALQEAREARLEEMEAARELAKQQREEARQNIDTDRRPPDG